MNNLYFSKTRSGAIIPSKIAENCGYDLYACFDEEFIIINPFSSRLIPTGIASAFDKQYGLILRERGSTGTQNLKINAGVIDSGYRGEIFVSLYNGNDYCVVIAKKEAIDKYPIMTTEYVYPYEKAIAQALLIPIPEVEVVEIPYNDLQQISSQRGFGKLGSTDK